MSYQLLVLWRSNNRSGFSVRVLLIEHDNTITLDEDRLKKLDYSSFTPLKNGHTTKNAWQLDDAIVLMTSKLEEQIRTIEITISRGSEEKGSREPIYVPSDM
jgi:hypothetical protein